MAQSFCDRRRNPARLGTWESTVIYILQRYNPARVGRPAEMGFRGGRATEKEENHRGLARGLKYPTRVTHSAAFYRPHGQEAVKSGCVRQSIEAPAAC